MPRYHYNAEACRYEPWFPSARMLRRRFFVFIALSLALAAGGYAAYVHYAGSVDEVMLQQKNQSLRVEWHLLQDRTAKSFVALQQLVEKDDHNYRMILDTEPLPASIREAGVGGSVKLDTAGFGNYQTIVGQYQQVQQLQHELAVETQSYKQLREMINDKLNAWASRPAIQPINNKQLDRLHLTYGTRLHPIFLVVREHKGLDFAASVGTPVYATGDGVIGKAYFSDSYGNVIYLLHGHGYETRYAHLSAFAVKEGDTVKRGQVIGYVGSTGNSKAPHLHYEVLFNNNNVNPINFFQRDLSNKEYEKLIEIGSRQNTVLD